MDAEIQAMDGNQSDVQVLHSGDLLASSFKAIERTPTVASRLPSLDAGFRHPCRNDGPPALAGSQAPAWEPMAYKLQLALLIVAREAGASKTAFPSWSFTAIKLSTNGVQGLPCEVPNYL